MNKHRSLSLLLLSLLIIGLIAPALAFSKPVSLKRESSSAAITYSGGWKTVKSKSFSGKSARQTGYAGVTATFQFTGTELALYGTRAPGYGTIQVKIDGKVRATKSTASKKRATKQRLVRVRGLKKGKHTVVITTTKPKRVQLDYLCVAGPKVGLHKWKPRANAVVESDSTALVYKNNWTRACGSPLSGGASYRASSPDSSVSFQFTGSELVLIGRKVKGGGSVAIGFEGSSEPTRTFSYSSSFTRYQQEIARIKLKQGTYKVKVQSRSKKPVEIDRVDVNGKSASIKRWHPKAATTPPINRKYLTPNYTNSFVNYRYVVLHHTASSNLSGTLSWLRTKRSSVSANYLLAKDGTIYELAAPYRRAWHAGAGSGFGVPKNSMNGYSVGIEIMNTGSGKDPYPLAQMDALEKLLAYLDEVYKPVPRIDHKAWAPGRKNDLSSNFPFARFGLPVAKGKSSTFGPLSIPDSGEQGVEPDLVDITGRGGETGFEVWRKR